MTDRRRARELAKAAVAAGRPVAWFEELYSEARAGTAVVPWDDRAPNPFLVEWLEAHPLPAGALALDVGCGTGDNAAELLRRGFRVTAFDVSPTALAVARERVGEGVEWAVADALELPEGWRGRFDLVVEVYTLQVLPPPERARAAANLAACVKRGGRLLLVARAREPGDPPGEMPWPLTRDEVSALPGLELESLRDVVDGEDPPVRRWVAAFTAR